MLLFGGSGWTKATQNHDLFFLTSSKWIVHSCFGQKPNENQVLAVFDRQMQATLHKQQETFKLFCRQWKENNTDEILDFLQ